MDTFTITAYDAAKQVVTADITLAARANFAGITVSGYKLSNPPTDTVANVQAFFRSYADAYIAGVQSDTVRKAAVSSEVAALLNVATSF
ncbi:MAG TPA: hypothetical protein VHY35_06305 [Stellaceae bacterium]|jgi:hypothetical protein|nr:hypothetical protein [Stellaceae bacterium]